MDLYIIPCSFFCSLPTFGFLIIYARIYIYIYPHDFIGGETQFDDMYNQWIRLSVVGYLRPELPFEGIDKLILAIKGDIEQTEKLCDDSAVAATTADADTDVKQEQPEKPTKEEDLPRIERQWVASLLSV